MPPTGDDHDNMLRGHFMDFRDDTLAVATPEGGAAARRTAEGRRQRRTLVAAMLAVTAVASTGYLLTNGAPWQAPLTGTSPNASTAVTSTPNSTPATSTPAGTPSATAPQTDAPTLTITVTKVAGRIGDTVTVLVTITNTGTATAEVGGWDALLPAGLRPGNCRDFGIGLVCRYYSSQSLAAGQSFASDLKLTIVGSDVHGGTVTVLGGPGQPTTATISVEVTP